MHAGEQDMTKTGQPTLLSTSSRDQHPRALRLHRATTVPQDSPSQGHGGTSTGAGLSLLLLELTPGRSGGFGLLPR